MAETVATVSAAPAFHAANAGSDKNSEAAEETETLPPPAPDVGNSTPPAANVGQEVTFKDNVCKRYYSGIIGTVSNIEIILRGNMYRGKHSGITVTERGQEIIFRDNMFKGVQT